MLPKHTRFCGLRTFAQRPLHVSIIPLANTWNHHLMLVVDTGIRITMTGLTVTEASYLTITPDQSRRDFIMLAPEIVSVRDSWKYITGIRPRGESART